MLKVAVLFWWQIFATFSGWDTLSLLTLESGYDEFLGEETEIPVFSNELKEFDGQMVTLEGYVIPLQQSMSQDYFVLSRFPYNNCFFCGNAGPETVAEVYTKEKFEFRDVRVRVTGRLQLNAEDPLHLFFILSDCEVEILD